MRAALPGCAALSSHTGLRQVKTCRDFWWRRTPFSLFLSSPLKMTRQRLQDKASPKPHWLLEGKRGKPHYCGHRHCSNQAWGDSKPPPVLSPRSLCPSAPRVSPLPAWQTRRRRRNELQRSSGQRFTGYETTRGMRGAPTARRDPPRHRHQPNHQPLSAPRLAGCLRSGSSASRSDARARGGQRDGHPGSPTCRCSPSSLSRGGWWVWVVGVPPRASSRDGHRWRQGHAGWWPCDGTRRTRRPPARARFYGHRVSSCGGARLRSAPRSQSGRAML